MRETPQEPQNIAEKQNRLNSGLGELEGLEAKLELPNSGDIKWAEGVVAMIDKLLEEKAIKSSEEDTANLLAKRQKLEDFIAESRERLE